MSRELVDGRVLADERQIAFAVAWPAIKALLRRAEQWRLAKPKREKTTTKELESHRVHLLEWSGLPRVAPFHRAVDRHDVRGDLGGLRQRVMAFRKQQLTKELRVPTARGRERVQAIVQWKALNEVEVLQNRLHRRRIVAGLPVECLDLLSNLLVEARAGFFSEPLFSDECAHPVRQHEVLAGRGRQAGRHVGQHIEPRDVARAEGRGFRAAKQRAGERVDLVYR